MATARITISSLFGAINSAASTVTSTFDTVTKGVGMANRFVSDAADQQAVRSVLNMSDFQTRLVDEMSMAEAIRRKEIAEFCKADTEQNDLFQSAHTRLQAILDAHNKA